MDGKRRSRPADAVIAALAEAQHGRVSRRQLLAAGIGRGAIEHRLGQGRLHQTLQGVYAVGHRVGTREARWMEALLACGPEAALTHRAAGAVWGVRPSELREVTVPRARRRPGVIVHRAVLPPDELTVRDGMAVTTVARTLLDLAAVCPEREVRRAIREAEFRRLGDLLSLADLVDRYPGRRGIAVVRAVLAEGRLGLDVTDSEFEERFLDLVAAAGLPRPSVNVAVLGFRCDMVWPDHRLIVELDGHASHKTRDVFESDRERDRLLAVAGWHVIRVTWRQLVQRPEALRRDLRRLLSRPRAMFSMT